MAGADWSEEKHREVFAVTSSMPFLKWKVEFDAEIDILTMARVMKSSFMLQDFGKKLLKE